MANMFLSNTYNSPGSTIEANLLTSPSNNSHRLRNRLAMNSTKHKYSLNITSDFAGLKLTNPTTQRLLLCGGRYQVFTGSIEDCSVSDDVQRDNTMPEHVAIILDGSRRWLKAHGKPLSYESFFEANMLFADLCIKYGVGTASTFVYSLKNLERGQAANDLIFGQLESFLDHNAQQFIRKGIRIRVIGQKCALPKSLRNKIKQVEEATSDCTKLEFNLAVCYSGTRDIVEATKNICHKAMTGEIDPQVIDEALLENELSTNDSQCPKIDLVIRTGGRLRVSDYLMWQMAQAVLYFTKVCGPEFSEPAFIDALRSFQRGERSFGK